VVGRRSRLLCCPEGGKVPLARELLRLHLSEHLAIEQFYLLLADNAWLDEAQQAEPVGHLRIVIEIGPGSSPRRDI